MFPPDQYQLLDFGNGRKLERFGPLVLDRPAPSADGCSREAPSLWRSADLRYDRESGTQGRWSGRTELGDDWTIEHPPFALRLIPNEFGHVGVFPEQAENWDWIANRSRQAGSADGSPLKILHLFAYTGAATLAAASSNAEVVHVDGARNVVAKARRNAELSGLSGASIRWITEDAGKFVARELKRGNRYDAVILDPPSYGRGPKGQEWKIGRDLPPLLDGIAELTRSDPRY
ncbi:MAG: class I SAM-dependent methyltransferase, partial [Planctomycetales bacterium]